MKRFEMLSTLLKAVGKCLLTNLMAERAILNTYLHFIGESPESILKDLIGGADGCL